MVLWVDEPDEQGCGFKVNIQFSTWTMWQGRAHDSRKSDPPRTPDRFSPSQYASESPCRQSPVAA